MSVQMNLRKPHRAADAGRGLLALCGVVALVVGVPVALVAWVGSPLPAEVPALSDITSALGDTYIPDEFLVKALASVCWLVWIELVASLLVEAVAFARGRKAGSVPLAGGLQQGAARLVATVALLGAVVATKGMPEPASRPSQPFAASTQPVVALVIDDDETTQPADDSAGPTAATEAAAPVYQVERRDTLWDIAERHLGDPLRWREIFQLNEGCPQPDGRCLTDPDLIFAGWQLELPADAVGLAPSPAPAAPAPPDEAPLDDSGASPTGSDPSSVVLDGGMVLIDDGGDESPGGDVLDGAVLVSSTTPPGTGSTVGGGSEAVPVAPTPPAPTEVTVEPGDNLWVMAEAQLATEWGRPPTDAEIAAHWQVLVEQNRARLLPPGDPDLIFPGQVLVAPAAPTDPVGAPAVTPAGSVPEAVAPAPEVAPPAPAEPADPPAPVDSADPADPADSANSATTVPAPPVVDDADAEADGATNPGPGETPGSTGSARPGNVVPESPGDDGPRRGHQDAGSGQRRARRARRRRGRPRRGIAASRAPTAGPAAPTRPGPRRGGAATPHPHR